VKITTSAGYYSFRIIEEVDSLIKEIPKHNYHPSTPSQSIKLQKASRALGC